MRLGVQTYYVHQVAVRSGVQIRSSDPHAPDQIARARSSVWEQRRHGAAATNNNRSFMLPRVGTLPTWNAVPPNRAQLQQHVLAAQRSKKKTQSSKGMQLRGESLVPSSVCATTAAAQQLLTTKGGTRVDSTQPRRACCGRTRVERDWVTWFFFGRPVGQKCPLKVRIGRRG